MKLALSVRIAELESQKDRAFMSIEQLAPKAHQLGFAGLSMRASVVSVDSPPERLAEVRRILDDNHLRASMVTGDVALAANRATWRAFSASRCHTWPSPTRWAATCSG